MLEFAEERTRRSGRGDLDSQSTGAIPVLLPCEEFRNFFASEDSPLDQLSPLSALDQLSPLDQPWPPVRTPNIGHKPASRTGGSDG
jgi:hypothetical protein